MHRVPGYPHLEQRVLPSLHGPCCSAWLHARLWSADCIWSSLVDLRGMKVCVVRTCKCVQSCFSCVRLFTTLWTVACQALLPMGFSRQEYWSDLPCPPPEIVLTQGSNPCLFHLLCWQAGSLPLAPSGKPHNCSTVPQSPASSHSNQLPVLPSH